MNRATVTFTAGLALVAIVLVVTLSGSPEVVARANGTPANEPINLAGAGASACQAEEVLPAGTSAIRITLEADVGPRVKVAVLSGPRIPASGSVGSGWTGGAVTVPVQPLERAVPNVRVCFGLGPTAEMVKVVGSRTNAAVAAQSLAGEPLPGRFTVEYMRRGAGSWWSSAELVARHIGLGRAPSGSWIALLLLALIGTAVAAGSWLVVKELR